MSRFHRVGNLHPVKVYEVHGHSTGRPGGGGQARGNEGVVGVQTGEQVEPGETPSLASVTTEEDVRTGRITG
eukprot:1187935-Prorocentrum_minimum.AAC.3